MNRKKEIIKNFFLVLCVLGIVIYYFMSNNTKDEEISYSEGIVNENIIQNERIEEINDKIKVYVIGEVKKPGVVELDVGARIEDAIIIAGGTTEYSDLSKVNLAYCLEDGQKICIPSTKEIIEENYITTENGDGVLESENNDKNSKININTGNLSELMNLPGVGESLAQRIITYREENGKFKNIEDLKNVSGIGDRKFENLKEYVCVK